jgi:hypothetical protein
VATLIDFTTAYTGGHAFFTGTGSAQVVPFVYPVAINGQTVHDWIQSQTILVVSLMRVFVIRLTNLLNLVSLLLTRRAMA